MELLSSEYFTLGNIFLAIVFLLILNQLIELYQFRNMPPGPRLTSLPFIGNLLSFDAGESLREATTRFVCTFRWFAIQASQLLLASYTNVNDVANFVFVTVLMKPGLRWLALSLTCLRSISAVFVERATVKNVNNNLSSLFAGFLVLCLTADPPAGSRLELQYTREITYVQYTESKLARNTTLICAIQVQMTLTQGSRVLMNVHRSTQWSPLEIECIPLPLLVALVSFQSRFPCFCLFFFLLWLSCLWPLASPRMQRIAWCNISFEDFFYSKLVLGPFTTCCSIRSRRNWFACSHLSLTSPLKDHWRAPNLVPRVSHLTALWRETLGTRLESPWGDGPLFLGGKRGWATLNFRLWLIFF